MGFYGYHTLRCGGENGRHHFDLIEQQMPSVYCLLIITQAATSKMSTHPSPSLPHPTVRLNISSNPAFSIQSGLSQMLGITMFIPNSPIVVLKHCKMSAKHTSVDHRINKMFSLGHSGQASMENILSCR